MRQSAIEDPARATPKRQEKSEKTTPLGMECLEILQRRSSDVNGEAH
jgi:hypothetical protein